MTKRVFGVAVLGCVLIVMGCQSPAGGSPTTPSGDPAGTVSGTPSVPAWVQTVVSGTSGSGFYHSVCDGSGNVFAVGYSAFSTNWGSGVTTSTASNQAAVLVKYDASGAPRWARVVSGTGTSVFDSVALDSSGSVYVLGQVVGTSSFDLGSSVTVVGPSASASVIVAKYRADGTAQWAKVVSGTTASSYNSLIVGGAVYASFEINGNAVADWGNGVSASNTATRSQGALVRLDSTGTAQWIVSLSGSDESDLYGLAADGTGMIYGVGTMSGNLAYVFDQGLSCSGPSDNVNPFLVKYNAQGKGQWVVTADSIASQCAFFGVKATPSRVVVVGYTDGVDSFASNLGHPAIPLLVSPPSGPGAMFVTQFDASGLAQWARTLDSSAGGVFASDLAMDGSGAVLAAGNLSGTGTFDFGGGLTTSSQVGSSKAGGTAFLVKYDAAGTPQSLRTVQGKAYSSFAGVTVDPLGAPVVTGRVSANGPVSLSGTASLAWSEPDTGTYAVVARVP